ncbi:uncharacterized protein LOC110853212 [Folsomia candida]|uniref:uncharacterized protein LOC110853212 n=1 Tax=Folsomia candida TaxID=158441 RepID=UPI000B909EE2|nr:uncharacterized protein LOC110853212 [Folsomia candida]XP_035710394.1 uncharacterized protein LOC110853212 [Folsomia candida]XP_035710395.1 uncharacterized protein LOC110853212 [Folsomia candida]XP_035710396.1 uncharacterized protein LOC110853212 [Folsomia candida]XP_035710397.1 uncharacterized protein LOC110853212 [Folsomia candida]
METYNQSQYNTGYNPYNPYPYHYHQNHHHGHHNLDYVDNSHHAGEGYGHNMYNANFDHFYYHDHDQDLTPPEPMILLPQQFGAEGHHSPEEVQVHSPPPPLAAYEIVLSSPKILSKILVHFSIQELKEKRHVCKVWEEEICTILRDKLVIHFNNYKGMVSYGKCMERNPSFCSVFSFGAIISLDGSYIQYWMALFGPHIRSLELQSRNLGVKTLSQILQHVQNVERLILQETGDEVEDKEVTTCLNQLAKLKYLKFHANSPSIEKNPAKAKIMKRLCHEILRIAPNLAQVEVNQIKDGNILSRNLEMMSDLSKNADLLNEPAPLEILLWSTLLESQFAQNIAKLELNVKLTSACVQSLTDKKFPLKWIDLKILAQVSNQVLHGFLTSVRETLVNIKIRYCGGPRLPYEADFPLTESFGLVKSVHLERYEGSLWFTEKTPNLIYLSFAKINLNKVVLKDVDCLGEGVHGNLKSFRVHEDFSNNVGPNRQRSIQTVQKLGMQFPSVRRLRLERLVDESLCLIYAQWPNLEELEIVHGLFSDAGTTAMHPNAYKVILREEAYDNFNVDALRQGLFLGSLSKLTRVKIHSPNVTDVTLILGVLPCPNIRSVSVQSFKITDTSLYRLVNKPSILNMSTKNCSQLTPAAMSYAGKAMSLRGGSTSLNKSKISLDVSQTIKFLERNPTCRVLLKRLSISPPKKPDFVEKSSKHDVQNEEEKAKPVALADPSPAKEKAKRGRPRLIPRPSPQEGQTQAPPSAATQAPARAPTLAPAPAPTVRQRRTRSFNKSGQIVQNPTEENVILAAADVQIDHVVVSSVPPMKDDSVTDNKSKKAKLSADDDDIQIVHVVAPAVPPTKQFSVPAATENKSKKAKLVSSRTTRQSRPIRNTGSIFRRFSDFELF